MWRVEDCLGLCCPSLSVIDTGGIMEYYCNVYGESADGLYELTFSMCNVHWPILDISGGCV